MGIHINGDYNINGDHNSVNVVHGDVNYGGGYDEPLSPPIGLFGVVVFFMIFIWLIIKFWWVVLIAAGAGVIIYAIWLKGEEKRRSEVEARRQEEELTARAESQNSAYLRGDPYGMFGRFPPG